MEHFLKCHNPGCLSKFRAMDGGCPTPEVRHRRAWGAPSTWQRSVPVVEQPFQDFHSLKQPAELVRCKDAEMGGKILDTALASLLE